VSFLKAIYWRLHSMLRSLAGLASPNEKIRALNAYASLGTLVETGTYLGDTTAGCAQAFPRIYTIELDPALAERAQRRFADQSNVKVVEGDSYIEVSKLAEEIKGPALFWLDAHYCSYGTARGPHNPPLPWELRAIMNRNEPDVILIDDAHHMGVKPTRIQQWIRDRVLKMLPTDPDYPTVDQIVGIMEGRLSEFKVNRDIIHITLSE
jgi:hypothetical protein